MYRLVSQLVDIACSLFLAAIGIFIAYRVVTGIPSDGLLEQCVRVGLSGIGTLAIIAWIIMFLNYITGKRES